MPTVFQPFGSQDEEKKKDQASQGGLQVPAPVSVGGPQGGAFTSGSASAPKPGAPSSSGQFTNIQKLINANKSADLAGQIVGKVGQQAEQSQQDIGNLQKAFQAQSQGASAGRTSDAAFQSPLTSSMPKQNFLGSPTAPGPNLILNQPGPKPGSVEDLVSRASTNAASLSPDEMSKLRTIVSGGGQYTGPKTLADVVADKDIGKVSSNVGKIQDIGKQSTTEAGRFGLLNQMFGRQGYGQGQQRLDQLLLSGNPNQAQKLQAGTSKLGANVGRQLQQAGQQAQQSGNEVAENLKQTFQGTQKGLTSAQEAINTANTAKAAEEKAKVDALQSAIQSGKLTREQAQSLGLDLSQGGFGFNPGNLGIAGPTSGEQVRTSEDAAKLQALASILGQTGNFGQGEYQSAKDAALSKLQSDFNANRQSALGKISAEQNVNNSGFSQWKENTDAKNAELANLQAAIDQGKISQYDVRVQEAVKQINAKYDPLIMEGAKNANSPELTRLLAQQHTGLDLSDYVAPEQVNSYFQR